MRFHAPVRSLIHSSIYVLLSLILTAGGVLAQGCLDYEDYILQVGQCEVGPDPIQFCIEGDLAYVLLYEEAVDIVDISDPCHPIRLGEIGNDMTTAVSAHGNLAYLSWWYGFKIMDMSDPAAPVLLGEVLDTSTSFRCSARVGDYLYVSRYASGMGIYDVSDSAAPFLHGEFEDSPRFDDILVEGNLVFLACKSQGVKILDASDPAAPTLLSDLPTDNESVAVDLAGSTLLVAEYVSDVSRLRFVDVSNPALPDVIGGIDLPGSSYDVCHLGDLAFVAAYQAELQVVDFGDPAAPQIMGAHPVRTSARGLEARNGHVFVSSGTDYAWNGCSYVTCFDVGNGQFPPPAESMTLESAVSAITTSGEMAYLGLSADGLAVMDTHGAGAPVLLGQVALPGVIVDIEIAGEHAFLAAGSAGLLLVDVGDPTAPVQVGDYAIPGGARCLVLDGDIAYVASGTHFYILNISDPSEPIQLGVFTYGYIDILDIACHGPAVYLSLSADFIYIVDVSDPSNPIFHDMDAGVHAYGGKMIVRDDVLFFSGDWRGASGHVDWASLYTIDISAPLAHDTIDIEYVGGHENEALALFGDYAYLDSEGLHVIDVSDPNDLRLAGFILENPTLLATTPQRLFMSGFEDEPGRLAWVPLQCGSGTAVEEEKPTTHALARLRSHPNPFNPSTVISFELPAAGRASLDIYDLAGRRVRRLLDAQLSAGPHERSWDGRDDAGHHLASGVYLARFSTGDVSAQGKMLLLK